MGSMMFLAWGYTVSKRAHIRADIVFNRYPPRLQAGFNFAMLILSVILFGVIAWQSASLAISDWQTGKLVSIILIPQAPFKLLVSLGSLLICVENIIQMVHLYPRAIRRKTN
jgi:TRAP-type C4-dicarboxylate transport system permease small subunit